MGDMLVAYEDDVPKDRGLKVSGHCALDSGLGVANTFGTYCKFLDCKLRASMEKPNVILWC